MTFDEWFATQVVQRSDDNAESWAMAGWNAALEEAKSVANEYTGADEMLGRLDNRKGD